MVANANHLGLAVGRRDDRPDLQRRRSLFIFVLVTKNGKNRNRCHPKMGLTEQPPFTSPSDRRPFFIDELPPEQEQEQA